MTLFGPQIQRVVRIYNGHLLSIERCIMRNISEFVSKQHEEITNKFK